MTTPKEHEAPEVTGLELSQEIIASFLKLMTKNEPNLTKIKALTDAQRKTMLKNVIDIAEDTGKFKLLADSRKKKKIYHIILSILEESSTEDQEYTAFRDRYEQLLIERNATKTRKRPKPKNQNDFAKDDEFNSCLKVQKTVNTISDKPIPSTWIKLNPIMREPIVFIDATDEKEAEAIKGKIEFNKIELKITAEITNIRVSGDKVITKLTNSSQEELFKSELKAILGPLNVYSPNLRDPMIMLYRIPVATNVDSLINDIRKFNNFNTADKIMLHKSFNIMSNAYKNVILRVSPAIRQEVENKRGLLLYKCSTIKAADYFGILRCTRCLRYAHLKTTCASQTVCKYCASFHRAEDCPHKFNPTKYKCASCNQEGHHADDKKNCGEYLRQLNYISSITNYSYEYVIQD